MYRVYHYPPANYWKKTFVKEVSSPRTVLELLPTLNNPVVEVVGSKGSLEIRDGRLVLWNKGADPIIPEEKVLLSA